MKKLWMAASVAAISMTGCQEEQFEGRPDPDNYYAAVETFGTDTRTALGEGHSVVWSSEDRIAIFEGNGSGQAYQVLDAYAGKSSGEFAEVEGLVAEGTGASLEGTIAVYPFNEDLSVTSGDNGDYIIEGISFPSEQKYIAGSFSDEAFPMTAICEQGSKNLSFKNIGGVLKLSLTGSYSVSLITLTGNSGEPLSGSATVTLGPDGIPSVTMSDDASTSVSLVCDPAVQLDPETATDFYISIPPTDFEAGFSITVTDSEFHQTIKTTDKQNITERSSVLAMPELYENDFGEAEAVEGFEKPVTESTDEYSITFQYNEGVILLNEAAQENIVRVEADSILYFSSSTPSELLPEVGDLVTSRISDKLPYGLGNKVLEVSEQGGAIRCVTTLASLDDIYKELSWEYNSSLTDSLIEGYIGENGNAVAPKYVWYNEETGDIDANATRGTVGHHKLIQWPFEFQTVDKESKVEGSIYVGAFVHCSGDVRNNNFEFYVEPIIGTDATFTAGIMFEADIWQDMFEWNIFKLKDKLKTFIQLGPLTLRPYVDIEAYLSAAASGTIDIELGKTFSARLGYSQTNGSYIQNTTAKGKENDFFRGIDMLNGNVAGKYRCLFDVGCGIYTKKVAIAIEPYFEYSLGAQLLLTLPEGENESIQKKATASFDIVAGAEGKMVVDWFGGLKWSPQMKFVETNIFHAETSLIPHLEEDTFTFKKDASSYIPKYDSRYNISGGLLSSVLDIYPGLAIYKDNALIHKELYTEKTVWNDTIPTSYTIKNLEEGVSYEARPIARILGYDLELDKNDGRWVDLGLPSGILWAKYNVGASSPEEYGGYYAWGETSTKSDYTWENYKYSEKYYFGDGAYDWYWAGKFIGNEISGTSYDVAHVQWGGGARMPTLAEVQELVDNCTFTGGSYNGVIGSYVTGPNGNSIFLPFAGYRYDGTLYNEGSYGYFWSGTYDGSYYGYDVYYLSCYGDYGDWSNYHRFNGQSVRPVTEK